MYDNVEEWLRAEAENLGIKYDKINTKMQKLIDKNGFDSFDKLTKLNQERVMVKSQQIKLYEMIGRINELKNSQDNKETFEKFERMEDIASEEGWISDFGETTIFLGLKNELRDGNDNMTLKEFIDKIEKEFKDEREE